MRWLREYLRGTWPSEQDVLGVYAANLREIVNYGRERLGDSFTVSVSLEREEKRPLVGAVLPRAGGSLRPAWFRIHVVHDRTKTEWRSRSYQMGEQLFPTWYLDARAHIFGRSPAARRDLGSRDPHGWDKAHKESIAQQIQRDVEHRVGFRVTVDLREHSSDLHRFDIKLRIVDPHDRSVLLEEPSYFDFEGFHNWREVDTAAARLRARCLVELDAETRNRLEGERTVTEIVDGVHPELER